MADVAALKQQNGDLEYRLGEQQNEAEHLRADIAALQRLNNDLEDQVEKQQEALNGMDVDVDDLGVEVGTLKDGLLETYPDYWRAEVDNYIERQFEGEAESKLLAFAKTFMEENVKSFLAELKNKIRYAMDL
jgi:chromosome segregation ATPase